MADHSENLISAYLDNQLGVEERAQFEERLQQDAELRELTESLRSQSNDLGALPKFSLSANVSQRILQDAQVAQVFEDSVVKPVAAATKLDHTEQSFNWRHTVGVIVSLAALLLIAAFLIIPKDFAANLATNMEADETASARSESSPTENEVFDDGRSNAVSPKGTSPKGTVSEKMAGSGGLASDAVAAGSEVDNFAAQTADADASRQDQVGQVEQKKMPGSGDLVVGGKANMRKGAPAGKARAKTDVPRQSANVRSRSQSPPPADKPAAVKAMTLQADNAVDADALAANEEVESADELFSPNADAFAGDVIEINFLATDRNVDRFVKSLEKNSISVDLNYQLSESKPSDSQPSRGAGGGRGARPLNSKQKAPREPYAGVTNQRAFFVEATDQQMQAVVDDLQQHATLVQRSADSAVQQLVDQIAPARRAETTAGIADDSLSKSDDQAMFANAREIQVPKIVKLNESQKILNQLNLKSSKKQADGESDDEQEQVLLRKYIVLLNMAEALDSSIEASEAPVSPADK